MQEKTDPCMHLCSFSTGSAGKLLAMIAQADRSTFTDGCLIGGVHTADFGLYAVLYPSTNRRFYLIEILFISCHTFLNLLNISSL